MCDVCHYTPCTPRCPNAPEPPVFCSCDHCPEPIRDGDIYYEKSDGTIICQSCIENMDTHELLIHLGCKGHVAEVST